MSQLTLTLIIVFSLQPLWASVCVEGGREFLFHQRADLNQSVVLGNFLRGGAEGEVYEVEGDDRLVAKVFRQMISFTGEVVREVTPLEKVIKKVEGYRILKEVFGKYAIDSGDIFIADDGAYGLVMERIIGHIDGAIHNHLTANVIAQVREVGKIASRNGLFLGDFQFAITFQGEVKLFDPGSLYSWNLGHSLYSPGVNRKLAEESWKQRVKELEVKVRPELK